MPTQILISIPDILNDELKNFQFSNKYNSRAAVIRDLLVYALQQKGAKITKQEGELKVGRPSETKQSTWQQMPTQQQIADHAAWAAEAEKNWVVAK